MAVVVVVGTVVDAVAVVADGAAATLLLSVAVADGRASSLFLSISLLSSWEPSLLL